MIKVSNTITIEPWEVIETFSISQGPGGQNVNKVETAVRLRHAPSGIVIENSETRSQLENKQKALQLLKSQLYEIQLKEKMAEREKIESNKRGGGMSTLEMTPPGTEPGTFERSDLSRKMTIDEAKYVTGCG